MKPTKTIKIKIMNVPKPTCTLEHITKIKDWYAQAYMKPMQKVSQPTLPAVNLPTRKRRV